MWMDLPNYNDTAARSRKGVCFLEEYAADNQLIWRETSGSDVGIDGQMEYVKRYANGKGKVTGNLLAFQVKTGKSYFQYETKDGWKYYLNDQETNYWKYYPIPVVLFLFNDQTRKGYFVDVRQKLRSRLRSSKEKYIIVPKENILNETKPELLFMNCGVTENEYNFKDLDDVIQFMQSKRTKSYDCYISFFEMFMMGITCQGGSIFFGIDLVMRLSEYYIDKYSSNFPDLTVSPSINFESDTLITEYLDFLVGFNIIYFDASYIYLDLKEDSIYPTFIAKLTEKGILLNQYIKKKYSSLLGYPLGLTIDVLNPNFFFKLKLLDKVMHPAE